MTSVTAIIVSAFILQVHANSNTQEDLTDTIVDRMLDKLVERVLGPADHADLDGTTLSGLTKTNSLMTRAAPASAMRFPGLLAGNKPSLRGMQAQAMPKELSMQAYSPYNAKKYETFGYLPQLSNDDIMKQIRFMIANNWAPALEFSDDGDVYLNTRMGPGYYDNRYWSLYKLPMFGCTDPSEVIREIESCKREFPNAVIRVLGFDSQRQVQSHAFVVSKGR